MQRLERRFTGLRNEGAKIIGGLKYCLLESTFGAQRESAIFASKMFDRLASVHEKDSVKLSVSASGTNGIVVGTTLSTSVGQSYMGGSQ